MDHLEEAKNKNREDGDAIKVGALKSQLSEIIRQEHNLKKCKTRLDELRAKPIEDFLSGEW